jgi:uncharacterized protein with von Willebrand factor type A (vWA) domain
MTTDTSSKDIIFILDESGSMDSMGKEPLEAVNSFIKEQKKVLQDNSTFTLWKFNSNTVKMFDDIPLSRVPEFTEYYPNDMTALYDAIGNAITTKKQKKNYDDVICVILTDGEENCSQEYKRENISKMIKSMEEEHNWKFIYLAANQDAFEIGTSYGFDTARCANFTCETDGLMNATQHASTAISNFRVQSRENPKIDLNL